MKLLWLLLFNLFLTKQALAAACCGGGFAIPSIISGDDKAQVTTSYSYGEIQADVYTSHLWRDREVSESSETFKIEAAHIFKDRWQAGFALPVVKRSRVKASSTGVGDISTQVAYEYLPDWDYHPYRPKGIGYIQLILPTGKSVYESDEDYGLDSRGRGFWALGLGTLLTKTFQKWDAFVNVEVHRAFSKNVTTNGLDIKLKPGWGSNLGIGMGYNTTKFRLGTSLSWSYEDPVAIQRGLQSEGSLQRYTSLGINASYLANEHWAATLSYSDQTLLGSPYNTSLSRSVMFLVQRRWLR